MARIHSLPMPAKQAISIGTAARSQRPYHIQPSSTRQARGTIRMGAAGEGFERQGSMLDRLKEQIPVSLATDRFGEEQDDVVEQAAAGQPAATDRLPPAVAAAPAAVKKLVHGDLTPAASLLSQKLGFVAGVSNIAITAWWMARFPETFYWWYTFKSAVLFGLRFIIYKSKKQHYFLLEMCYAVNLILLALLWLPSTRRPFYFKAGFGLVTGPLTWSIIALRNSLVLHSLDQMTSLFMHASPALVMYALRWYPSQRMIDFAALPAAQAAQFQNASFVDLVGGAMVLYAVWAISYYVKVFVVSAGKIQEQNYETLYTLMTANKKGMCARIVFSVPKPVQPLIYMLFHALLSFAAACTSYLWWHNFWAHTVFVLLMLLGAAWNGATYYFSPRFLSRVSKSLEKKIS